MSLQNCPRVLAGATLIDGTGAPPVKDSVIVIQDQYITAVGKRDQTPIPEGAEVYNLDGQTLTPGFIDSHCHFLRMGVGMITRLDLSDAKTLTEALQKLVKRAKQTKPGEWILGRGFDEAKWPENRYLNKNDLDPLTPDNPVMLVRVCGHLISVNTPAMEAAGITGETVDPEGGTIDRNNAGQPTGVLRDCRQLVTRVIPHTTQETMVEGVREASLLALSLGCTGVHDAGMEANQIRAYQKAYRSGALMVRAYMMLRGSIPKAAASVGILTGFGDHMLRIGSAKILMDGSLGARTAALYEPYADDPSNTGLLMMSHDELVERVTSAHNAGLQVATHAIGDLAIEHALDAVDEALRLSPRKDHRHRIEHCEILSSQQIERIKRLGIVPDMQPNFVGEWSGPDSMYRQRLGERRDRMSNPYRALLDEGIPLAFGSDGMPFNPIYGVWSAVNHPIRENRITLTEAIMCYTLNAAYSGFQETYTGSIEPGKLADVAVFDRDLTEIESSEIRDANCTMTLVNGKILFSV